jgi:hypothetical protein
MIRGKILPTAGVTPAPKAHPLSGTLLDSPCLPIVDHNGLLATCGHKTVAFEIRWLTFRLIRIVDTAEGANHALFNHALFSACLIVFVRRYLFVGCSRCAVDLSGQR